jgi:predicted nucleotidyltransferase/predicted ester cyclase
VATLDLSPERRDRLAAELRAALTAAIPDSRAELRGSLACGTADPYSDIDLAWVVPDDMFAAAVESAATAIQSVGAVSSLRRDPDLARSDRRRLLFFRLAGLPLFWRVDLDIRAASVAADSGYDDANPAARSEAGWSRPASAMENAAAAIKAALRGLPSIADGLLSRGYQRIGLDPAPTADLPSRITRLVDSCAALEPGLTALAAEVREVLQAFARAGGMVNPEVKTSAQVMLAMVAAFDSGDLSTIAETVDPDYLDHQGLEDRHPLVGIDGFSRVVKAARAGFSELSVTVADLIEGTDRVAARILWVGVQPSGEGIQRETIDIIRVVDGRAIEHWGAQS